MIVVLLSVSALAAADTASAARAILERSCVKCHGPDKQKGGLRLDSHAAVRKGGTEGEVVVAGEPEKSRLIAAIGWTDEDTRMPPKQKLSDEDIAILTEWVRAGAAWPAD
jgi:mono/diheme cytochrome c family protein